MLNKYGPWWPLRSNGPKSLLPGLVTILLGTTLSAQVCPTTVTDVDGNEYGVVQVGDRCWMAENLRAGHYRNGWPIMSDLTVYEWNYTLIGAYLDVDQWGEDWGKLYNWWAVADPRGICPEGWSVASNTDWDELVDAFGGAAVASDALRSQQGWMQPDPGATNASGFSAKPAGFRYWYFDGNYNGSGTGALFWTSTPNGNLMSYARVLYRLPEVFTYYDDPYFAYNGHAMACRCIMDPITSIGDRTSSSPIRIFPNPAEDRFFVEWEHTLPAELELVDAMGRIVRSTRITDPITPIDITALVPGMYFARINGNGVNFTGQVIKKD